MTDFASIGIQLDSRPVTEGTKALDALAEASTRVEQKVRVSNGQMADTAKIMQAQAEQARAAVAGNSALSASTNQLTLGQQQLIEKFREQAATIGMSRSQMMAYQAAQYGLTTQTQQSIAAVKAHEDAIKAAAKAKEDAAKSANQLTDALKFLAAGYALLKIGEYIKDSALLAARFETLGVVMEVVGRNAGYTKTQMVTATEAIASQGITMLESRQSAIKLVQAHIDLKNATGLARIAQDAAVIGNINSSEAFDRLVNGIARGNVLILRNIGINVNLQTAYAQMADSLGKNSKELTENERVQARLNAVTERGTDINGTYTASMDTAGKQLKSMQRYTEDLKVMVGETFNEVLTIAVMGFTEHLKDSNKEVSEMSKNGQLAEWGHNLATVFVGVANAIDNILTGVKMAGTWAGHQSAGADINAKYDKMQVTAPQKATLAGAAEQGAMIERERQAAFAKERTDYEAAQVALGAQVDRFQRAFDERAAAQLAKMKDAAAAKLAVDADYMAKLLIVIKENEGKATAVKQAAIEKLYNSVYVGTPTYRDTDGRPPKDVTKEISDYEKLMKILNEKLAVENAAFTSTEKLTEAEKIRVKLLADLAGGTSVMTAAEKLSALARLDVIDTLEKGKLASDAMAKMYANIAAEAQKSVDAANKEADANERLAQNWGLTKDQIAANELARLEEQMAQRASIGLTLDEIDTLGKLITAKKRSADAAAIVQGNVDGAAAQKAAEYASKKLADMAIQDWKNVGSSIADSLSTAFGAGGKALGQMFKAYADGNAAQLRAQKELALAKKLSDDDPTKIKMIDDIQRQSSQAQLKSYGDMADAAQGFFDAGSRGYQALGAASKVMHVAELAMNLASIGPAMAAGAAQFFAQSGWGGFAGVAAMAAVVTAFGVAVSGSGSGGGQSAADVQKAQGTGSVFGDSTAKSDSIARSIALATANSSIELTHTAGMLAALKNIEASMAGLTNLVVRAPGVTDGSNMGIQTGILSQGPGGLMGSVTSLLAQVPLIGGLLGGLSNLWGKTTQNVVDSGLQFGGSVNALQAGQGYQQYASVDTTKSSFFGLSKSTSNSVQTQGLSSELSSQFGLIFTNLEDALKVAAVGLGVGADQVTRALDSLTIDTTKISLKGLTGDALTSAINGVISKTMDQMAQAAFPNLDSFRKVGEGYAETVVRVATDYANLDSILQASGMTFGAVGLSSLKAREDLITLAGGIDSLASKSNSFATNFLSQAEQLAPVTKYVDEAMAGWGLSAVKTRDQFKDVVLGLDLTTASGQAEYVALMGLADAFAKTHAATVDLTQSTQAIADERKNLQDQLDQLTMTSAQLLTKQRNALDASNRALFDQVQAATAAKAAQDAAKASLSGVISTMKTFGDSAKALHDGLLTGGLSTLTPEQQYAETKRQYDSTLALAKGGDTTAQSQYSAMATAFLTASQKVNSGDSQYSADFAGILQTSDDMAKWATGQVDVAQASLDALNAQVIGISNLNATMQGVADAITGLPAAFVATPPAVVMPAPVINYSTMGTANTDALVAEIKSLRDEVAGLRADNQKLTGAGIVANDQSQQAAADTIVSGVSVAISSAASANYKLVLE